jgi:coenzyme F420-dependent glucose-6-phosphate dehydrogenase
MTMSYGYKASAEQFATRPLLEYSVKAAQVGFDTVAVSDHFQPWRHSTGRAPGVLPWLGALANAAPNVRIGTSVLTPTMRYLPAVVAQAFSTLAHLTQGGVFLGVGSGEAMNEIAVTGDGWPGGRERRRRMEEAIHLINRLWREERVDFDGEYYRTVRATVYERTEQPPPIYVAASGPIAAKLVGRTGDGLICTSGKRIELYRELQEKVDEGARDAGRDPSKIARMIEMKVSYDTDLARAKENCQWWAALSLSADQKAGVEDPVELERLAEANSHLAEERFIVTTDPDEVVERTAPYVEAGFHELVFHGPGEDQHRFLELFSRDVLPRLRERFGN